MARREMGDGGDEKIALLSEETKWSRWVFLWEWEERQRQLLLAAAAEPNPPPPLAAGDDVLYKLDGRHWRVMKLMRPASTAQYNAARNLLGKLESAADATPAEAEATPAEVEAPPAEAPTAGVPMAEAAPAEEAAPASDVDGAMDVDASADATGGGAADGAADAALRRRRRRRASLRPTAAWRRSAWWRTTGRGGGCLGRSTPTTALRRRRAGCRWWTISPRAVRAGVPLRRYPVRARLDPRDPSLLVDSAGATRDAVAAAAAARAAAVATVATVRARNNETPKMLAETLGVDVEALIAANKEKYKGIKPASRLMEGPIIIVPAGGKAAASSAPVVAAEHDGVALHLSYTNSTGYLGVRRVVQAKGAVFVAEYKRTTIGRYEAAVDAAVAFANKLKEVEAADEAAAEEARAAAAAKGLAVEADGVKLLCSEESPTGYLGVTQEEAEAKEAEPPSSSSFVARHGSAKLGPYDTAVEAAVAYAKHVQKAKEAQAPGVRAAAAERLRLGDSDDGPTPRQAMGLRLWMSEKSSSGYAGVRMKGIRYAAEKGGVTIGTYDTAVEAAVAYAQHVGEAPPTAPKAPRPNVQKQHEGVNLHLSPQSSTGYLGVQEASPGRFWAQYKQERLGIYDDVLDAAVAYARHVQKAAEEAEAAERAAAAEKGIAAEAEGLRLHIDMKGLNSTGYLGVSMSHEKYLARYANKTLGCYDTALEAAVAYARGRKEEEDAARALLDGVDDDDGS